VGVVGEEDGEGVFDGKIPGSEQKSLYVYLNALTSCPSGKGVLLSM